MQIDKALLVRKSFRAIFHSLVVRTTRLEVRTVAVRSARRLVPVLVLELMVVVVVVVVELVPAPALAPVLVLVAGVVVVVVYHIHLHRLLDTDLVVRND